MPADIEISLPRHRHHMDGEALDLLAAALVGHLHPQQGRCFHDHVQIGRLLALAGLPIADQMAVSRFGLGSRVDQAGVEAGASTQQQAG